MDGQGQAIIEKKAEWFPVEPNLWLLHTLFSVPKFKINQCAWNAFFMASHFDYSTTEERSISPPST